jgi:transposase
LTKEVAGRDYTLLQTVPGIGQHLGATLLYELGDIQRFPTVKDFLSYCRLVKGTVASAGKIKGLRGVNWAIPICAGPLVKRPSSPSAVTS